MNTWLKDLVGDRDSKDAVPMLFGEGFGKLVRERLDIDKPCPAFYKGHTKETMVATATAVAIIRKGVATQQKQNCPEIINNSKKNYEHDL